MNIFKNFFAGKNSHSKDVTRFLRELGGDISLIKNFPPAEAKYGDFSDFNRRIKDALSDMGIASLYSHQSKASSLALSGKDIVVVTPTSSGKTLCYNLPVIETMLKDENSHALYLFPSKALAQDQMAELSEFSSAMCFDVHPFTYDGDTSPKNRRDARERGRIIITNPDMLSVGILPHHESWGNFFRNLKYIVVDELHTYRGVFGSHLANIFSRTERICAFHGSHPTFICCSATIANPLGHAEALTGRKMTMVSENGAPSPKKNIIIYSPPIVKNKPLIRRSSLYDSSALASEALASGINTIVFTRSRSNVEMIAELIRKMAKDKGLPPSYITGYRAGYLPRERRTIEKGLRCGKIKCVVSTNALELGIDIGSLELAVIHGYPGSIASAWQQIGRAGRRGKASFAVIIASDRPSDRFLAANPEWFFKASPETALISPSNPYIFVEHVKCSCAELPFKEGELFAGRDVSAILEYLAERGMVLKTKDLDKTLYMKAKEFHPASELNLRNSHGRPYTIFDITSKEEGIAIGKMDFAAALIQIFPGASYFHNGRSYTVEKLDTEKLRCYVKESNLNIYTEADSKIRITMVSENERAGNFGWGEAMVVLTPYLYKIKDRKTHEIIGHGAIDLPETAIKTDAFLMAVPETFENRCELKAALEATERLFGIIVPIFLMCAPEDIKIHVKIKDPILKRSALFIADMAPGGVGLAEGAYELRSKILSASRAALISCKCTGGCPACIGNYKSDVNLKKAALELIEALLSEEEKS